MTRVIKFRAWHKKEEVMFMVGGFANMDYPPHDPYNYVTIAATDTNRPDDSTPNMDDIELMQYTGLKDKNGVEIYEGDILRSSNLGNAGGYCSKDDWRYQVFTVRYANARFCLLGSDEANESYPDMDINAVYEIIGNIYENPELIKGDL